MPPLDAANVRAHVDRMCTSESFAGSERLQRFLRYTVDATLAGEAENIKEYVLGRDVFDRDEQYDPRLDPIVRVEARRLRAKLADYYAGPGSRDSIRIDYPKGRYLPFIRRGSRLPQFSESVKPKWVWAASLALVAVIIFVCAMRPASPMIAVLPARWLWPSEIDLHPSDTTLAESVTGDLANSGVARVVAWPVLLEAQGKAISLRLLPSRFGATTAVVVSVRNIEGTHLVTAFLIDATTGEKLRSVSFLRREISTFASQQLAARDITAALVKSDRL